MKVKSEKKIPFGWISKKRNCGGFYIIPIEVFMIEMCLFFFGDHSRLASEIKKFKIHLWPEWLSIFVLWVKYCSGNNEMNIKDSGTTSYMRIHIGAAIWEFEKQNIFFLSFSTVDTKCMLNYLDMYEICITSMRTPLTKYVGKVSRVYRFIQYLFLQEKNVRFNIILMFCVWVNAFSYDMYAMWTQQIT